MTPVEELRAAATRVRRLAGATSPPPWLLLSPAPAESTSICSASGDMVVQRGDSDLPSRADAEYIATMRSIPVQLANALDLEAANVVAQRLGEQKAGVEPGTLTGKLDDALLALARALLGGAS